MEFTAGLMPLETALTEMLSRVTPLTAVETLPLVQCFAVFWRPTWFRRWTYRVSITRRWTVTRYDWPISPADIRCRSLVKYSPVSRSRGMACGELHSHYDRCAGTAGM